MRLKEVFVDFPLTIRLAKKGPKSREVRTFEPKKYPNRRLIRRIQSDIERLQARFLSMDYRVEETSVRGERALRVRRGKVGPENPPVYYFPKSGRIYVPSSYLRRRKRLTLSILCYRLKAWGVI